MQCSSTVFLVGVLDRGRIIFGDWSSDGNQACKRSAYAAGGSLEQTQRTIEPRFAQYKPSQMDEAALINCLSKPQVVEHFQSNTRGTRTMWRKQFR